LKQLQLIQILRINAASAAAVADVAANIRNVNRRSLARDAVKRYPAARILPSTVGKT
jgi:hypothetical protein